MADAWKFETHEAAPTSITCNFRPTCLYHGETPMCLHGVKGLEFDLPHANGDTHKGHAFDVEMICPECNMFEVFGVAVSGDGLASCQ